MSLLNQTLRSIAPRIATHGLRFASVLAPMMRSTTATSATESFHTRYPELLADPMTPQVMDEIQYILKDAGSKEYKPPKTTAEETEELLHDLQSAVEVATGMVETLSQSTQPIAQPAEDSQKLHVSRILSVRDEPSAGGKTIELEISPADLHRFLGTQAVGVLGKHRPSMPAGLGKQGTADRRFASARALACTNCRFASSCSRAISFSESWSVDQHCLAGNGVMSARGSQILDQIDDRKALRWAMAIAGLLGLGTAVEWATGQTMRELRGLPCLGGIPTTTISNIMFCL
ncbi:hypothetical protein EC988_007818 [Linderina pennispora]|nr:hypothetical protein EC988_007818 [Linderina pennispora]